MMSMMLIEVAIKAVILCLLIYLFAKSEADYSFQKVMLVTAGITLGGVIIEALIVVSIEKYLPGWTPAAHYFALFPVFMLVLYMIKSYCWVPLGRASIITIIFIAFSAGLSAAAVHFQTKAASAVNAKMDGVLMGQKEDFAEFAKFYKGDARKQVEKRLGEAGLMDAPTNTDTPPEIQAPPPPPPPEAAPAIKPEPASIATPPPPESRPAATPSADSFSDSASPAGSPKDWDIVKHRIKISGIMAGKGGAQLALIDNKFYSKGDIFTVNYQGAIYRLRIKDIASGKVAWESMDVKPAN